MFDYLDILSGRFDQTLTGVYYRTRPNSPDDERIEFNYEPVDVKSWAYKQLFGNLENSEGATYAIRTNDDEGYKVGGYIITQGGSICQIVQVEKDILSGNREAFRYLKDVPAIHYVMRLVQVEDLWLTESE